MATDSLLPVQQIEHRTACPQTIYIIDFIRGSTGQAEPEIVSRLIRHAANLDEAKKDAECLLRGINFLTVQIVRILDQDGVEIASWALDRDQ